MKCPICKKGTMRSWKSLEVRFGETAPIRGEKCSTCNETLVGETELGRFERMIATRLVARGIRAGTELKFVRKVAGLRATELAALLGVDAKTVSRWETDEVAAPLATRYVIADLLEHPKRARERLAAFT